MSIFSSLKNKGGQLVSIVVYKKLKHGYIFDTEYDMHINTIILDASSNINIFESDKLKGKSVSDAYLCIRKETTTDSFNRQIKYAKQNNTRVYTYLCCDIENYEVLKCVINAPWTAFSIDGMITLDLSNSKIYKIFHEYFLDDMEWKITNNFLGYKAIGKMDDFMYIAKKLSAIIDND